jgi:hypothetical protein
MLRLGRTVLGRTSEGESHCFLPLHAVSGRKRKSGLFAAIAGRLPAFPFAFKDSSGGKMTFENKEHDFPQRVIYERREPRLLLAAIQGTYKGKGEREEFRVRKVDCNPRDE